MTPAINLIKFGISPEADIRGSVVSHRLNGRRLLFLFAERHTIRPGIRLHLLNAARLYDQGVISCVGVEGCVPSGEQFPCAEVTQLYEEQRQLHASNLELIIDRMVERYPPQRRFLFWETLALLRPALRLQSVDEEELVMRVSTTTGSRDQRQMRIADFLRRSALFETEHPHRECCIHAKAVMQVEQEFAEHDLNVKRDNYLLTKMLSLWDGASADGDKPAILNAGTSHQYRIARRLQADLNNDVSYILIEQP
jgi:hypothetical protein